MSKNLYDNFRKNGRNLRQQPSGRAWKRLESRLDGSQGVQRTLHTRWWVMAASVLLLVGVMRNQYIAIVHVNVHFVPLCVLSSL